MPNRLIEPVSTTQIMTAVTTNTSSSAVILDVAPRTYYGTITGSGVISCTVTIQGSVDNSAYTTIATLSLTGTAFNGQFSNSTDKFPYVRATTTSITGTGATVNIYAFN